MSTPSMRSLEKAIELLRHLSADGGKRAVSVLAAEIGLPPATAYRIAATFERAGFITRLQRGHYLPGPTLFELAGPGSLKRVLTGVGRPIVAKLARQTRCTAHLGIFEGGMVTYLLKSGGSRAGLFTREGTQLEAYCTGIGKVLLAALAPVDLEDYLANGPFIRLTPNTLTEPVTLRTALSEVRAQDYATDNAEMDTDLSCLAVPVRNRQGQAIAALSIARRDPKASANSLLPHLETLRNAAKALAQRLEPLR